MRGLKELLESNPCKIVGKDSSFLTELHNELIVIKHVDESVMENCRSRK
jgi:hypothetical protein